MENFINLFPTPVLSLKLKRDFVAEEIQFFNKLTDNVRDNIGNKTSIDTNVLNNPELEHLKIALTSMANSYLDSVDNPASDLKLYITQSWMNLTGQKGWHHQHSHPNSYVSGVFYTNANKATDKITFYNPKNNQFSILPKTYNLYNSKSWSIPVETGDLLLFPSSLMHMVETVETDSVRTSIAFNTFFKGTLGNELDLTLLNLKGE